MVERAGSAQVPTAPPTPYPERGQQTAQPVSGASASPGFWGMAPGLTPPSETPASAALSSMQTAANKAESDAQQAILKLRAAELELAAIDRDYSLQTQAAKDLAQKVGNLRETAIEATIFNARCQRAASQNPMGFSPNRFNDPSGVAQAEILLDQAHGNPIGRAYTAREDLSQTLGQLEYARNWLAQAEQHGTEEEIGAARAELARCEKACIAAARSNVTAWETAGRAEVWGRKPDPAFYDTPAIREIRAGLAEAEEIARSINAGASPLAADAPRRGTDNR